MKLQPGPDDRGLRLDVFLARHLENLTRSQIQLLNRSGAVLIEGRHDKENSSHRAASFGEACRLTRTMTCFCSLISSLPRDPSSLRSSG